MINRSKLKALLLMAVVFLLGVVVGASLGTAVVSKKFASSPESPGGKGRHQIIEKFRTRLNLSSQQTLKLEVILEESRQQYEALRGSVKPQFEGIRQQTRSRIREILDEDQKREFEIMVQEYDQRKRSKKHK